MVALPSPENCQVIKSKHTFWGSPRRDLQKIWWGCMNYHIFQKETINLCFSKQNKTKKRKRKKYNKRERMSWALHNFHDSKPFALHCCVQSLHLLYFKAKISCLCIPKLICFISGYKDIDFSLCACFQNPMSYLLSLDSGKEPAHAYDC